MKKSYTGPNGVKYDYTYDDNNRLSTIAVPGQGSITYNSYHWNNPEKITLPGGSSINYTYDPLMQIKSIVSNDPGENPVVTSDNKRTGVRPSFLTKSTEHDK